jgi:hypothetical protein
VVIFKLWTRHVTGELMVGTVASTLKVMPLKDSRHVREEALAMRVQRLNVGV